MAKKENLVAEVEKAYAKVKAAEQEALHNALVGVISEHNASVENAWFVLRSILFQLEMARYKEISGVVKLTDKAPLKATKAEE